MKIVLAKMTHTHGGTQQYSLGDADLNQALDRRMLISHGGRILCTACGNQTPKSYGDGYCFPCFSSLAAADSCIMRPHTCHFTKGTCREPDWGEQHCMIPHVTYLALTSLVKVGVTGAHRVLARWGDQGASQAVILAQTPDRLTAGKIEKALSNHMPDRTNWRRLITSDPEPVDLLKAKNKAAELVPKKLKQHLVDSQELVQFSYPVLSYPDKAKTRNLDKHKTIAGVLKGIKGQYLLFEDFAFNVRRHSGYEVEIQLD